MSIETTDPIFALVRQDERAWAEYDDRRRGINERFATISDSFKSPEQWAEEYKRAGLPFTPANEDEWWEPQLLVLDDADVAVIECQPRTLAGLAAKTARLSRLSRLQNGTGDHGGLSDAAMFTALGLDAEALLEGRAA